jgi:hypothetical protein
MACMPRQHLLRFDKSSSLDTRLASVMPGAPKVRIVRYRDSGLRQTCISSSWFEDDIDSLPFWLKCIFECFLTAQVGCGGVRLS